MVAEKKWLAVYTRPNFERKVSAVLTEKNIENFCPLNKVVRQWADRKKIIWEPLFKNYVFVQADRQQYTPIRQISGIVDFVKWLGVPAVIRDQEIECIRNFLTEVETISAEKITVNKDDTIKIISGAFNLMEGKVLEVKNNFIKVLLPTLGYALTAHVRKTDVEIIRVIEKLNSNNFTKAVNV